LTAARAAIAELAEEHDVPAENLLLPDLLRRTCWTPPEGVDVESVRAHLRANGAREWQIGLTAEPLAAALRADA
jgi:ribonuclease D